MTGLAELAGEPPLRGHPAKATEQAVLDWVPAGMTVTVTASPVKGLEPTIGLAESWPPGVTGWCRTWPPVGGRASSTWTRSWPG